MSKKNMESSKTLFKRIGQNFKKSKVAFKIGLVANCIAILAFILCLLRIYSLYAVITFGVCILIAFIAFGVLLVDTLNHRAK